MESNKLEALVGNHCSVGYVVRIIIRGIVCSIRVVVDPRSTMRRRCIQLVMLVIAFLRSMQLWKTGRQIIRHQPLRWTVRFVIYILIEPGYTYNYINPDLVDKCGLRKEVHAKY